MTADASQAGAAPRKRWRWRRIAESVRDTAIGYGQWLHAEAASAWGDGRVARPAARHALVVATSLPPRFDGGVFRPLSWFKYASRNGWRVHALTPAAEGDETEAGRQLAAMIPRDVVIHRAREPELRPSRRLFMQVDGGFLTALALYRAGADAFADAPPSVVVATGPSFAAFIAALLLARRFRARLLLDYRDEWSENPFGFVEKGRDNRWWERRCLRAADTVLFTTESQLRHAGATFPGAMGNKGAVLFNGWEPDPCVASAESERRMNGRFVIASSGVLGTMAPPGPFLQDLARVLHAKPGLRTVLRLRFIGRRLASAERKLAQFPYPDLLDLIDQRPRPDADRLIRQSDVLLLLTNADMVRYLPGKLFEYLATGRPILVYGHRGEAQALVERLGAGLYVDEGDAGALARALHALSHTPSTAWSSRRRRDWAREHTRERLARAFFRRLDRLTAPHGTGAGHR